MGSFDFLMFWKKPKRVYTHLDEELLKHNEIIKQQQQKISAQEAQLSKIFAIEKQKRDVQEDSKKENEFNRRLQEQKEELEAHKYGKVIKLGKFYKHLFKNKKFREKLEIVDKNDEVILGKFGDFGIMEGGKLCILDANGDLMAYGKSLSHILYKPDAFENMARRGRFTIPMDKDGNWMEDLEYKEMPEPLDAEYEEDTGKIRHGSIIWSKVKTSEVKKIIQEKMETIHRLQGELETAEDLVRKKNKRIDDLTRDNRTNRAEADIAQSELSKSLNTFIETNKHLGDMHTQITKLTELKAMHQNLLDRKDEVIDGVIKKLELTGDPKADRIRGEIFKEIERYKALLPEKVEIKQEAPIEPRVPAQPGDVLNK